jgi:hypothetical protein
MDKEQILELLKDREIRAEIVDILSEVGSDRVFVLEPMNFKQLSLLSFDLKNKTLDREIERRGGDLNGIYNLNADRL